MKTKLYTTPAEVLAGGLDQPAKVRVGETYLYAARGELLLMRVLEVDRVRDRMHGIGVAKSGDIGAYWYRAGADCEPPVHTLFSTVAEAEAFMTEARTCHKQE